MSLFLEKTQFLLYIIRLYSKQKKYKNNSICVRMKIRLHSKFGSHTTGCSKADIWHNLHFVYRYIYKDYSHWYFNIIPIDVSVLYPMTFQPHSFLISDCPGCGVGDFQCSELHMCESPCGKIISIGHPLPYPNNHRCSWLIR